VFLKILEILSKIKVPLSTLISQFQRFCQERIVFPFSDVNKANFCLKKIETEYKKILRYGRIGNFSYVDGLSVEYPDWWFNLRISNTEPLMRLTIEADSVELLKEKKQELFKLIPF
jgi:phosphomannomutase